LALAVDPVQRGLWIGFYQGGLAYLADGQVLASYSAASGLGEGGVNGLRFDPDGTLWASTEGGLSRFKNGRIATLTGRNGLPCDSTHWAMEGDDHAFWLYTACGLVRIARSEIDAWAAAVDQRKDANTTIHATVLDSSEGVRSLEDNGGYSPHAAKSSDGRIWFTSGNGAGVVDPHHLPFNRLPPPVRIEQITADHKTYPPASAGNGHLRLPPRVRDLEIDYTALSLVAPEKVLFRYKLEGLERDWQDAGARRQAFYAHLSPGPYSFRVIACNNSGLWNEAGDRFDFLITPAFYQTAWFRGLCMAAFLALTWGLYRYRLHQIGQEFAARMGERMRIARELHDTLLQTFHGLMLRLQVVDELLPPGKAKEELEQTLECADQAIIESRDAVCDLRSSALTTNDLAHAVRALGDELAGEGSATFRLIVEGPARDLHPIVRDELYRIAREALRNAFRHASAHHIEAEIIYAERLLRLRIRDDGQGIAPEILQEGRTGHYGLPGIRERARQIGSKVSIRSGPGAGTEIDLRVAGSIAYSKAPGPRLRLFRKKVG
jgi:signal transduction histidine kinase